MSYKEEIDIHDDGICARHIIDIELKDEFLLQNVTLNFISAKGTTESIHFIAPNGDSAFFTEGSTSLIPLPSMEETWEGAVKNALEERRYENDLFFAILGATIVGPAWAKGVLGDEENLFSDALDELLIEMKQGEDE